MLYVLLIVFGLMFLSFALLQADKASTRSRNRPPPPEEP